MQPESPRVSILVPAFRPEFLDLSVSSALGQTFRDFELLISDDSSGDAIEAAASKWNDGRIKYMRNPTERRAGSNRDFLLSMASGKYVKFLFDDDFLFPAALENMVEAAESSQAQLVFGSWYIVDEAGQVLRTCGPSDDWHPPAELSAEWFFEHVIAPATNFIGNPTNVLIERAALEGLVQPFRLDTIPMRFLTDVVLFLNLLHAGFKLVGVDYFCSAFRQHSSQYSDTGGPASAAGIFEWEWLQRWGADHGYITVARCEEALGWRHRSYEPYRDAYPEIAAFAALGTSQAANGRFLTDEFQRVLKQAHDTVDRRLANALSERRKEESDPVIALQERLANREMQIRQLNEVVEHRDKHRRELMEVVRHRDDQIAYRDQQILQRDEAIESLRRDGVRRDGELATLAKSISILDSQIASKDHELEARHKQILGLQEQANELDMLKRSRLLQLRQIVREEPLSLRKLRRLGAFPLSVFRNAARTDHLQANQASRDANPFPTSVEQELDPEFYLRAYPDLAAVGVDPLSHYLQYGKDEGRLGHMAEIPLLGRLDQLDPDRETVLVVNHTGSRTGAPVLGYNISRELLLRFNVVVLFLKPGPMLQACRSLGAVVAGPAALPHSEYYCQLVIRQLSEKAGFKFAIVNSIESRYVLPGLSNLFVPAISIVHEFSAYTRPPGAFVEAVYWSSESVFSSNVTKDDACANNPELEGFTFPVIPQGRCANGATNSADAVMTAESTLLRQAVRPATFPPEGVVILGIGEVQIRKGVDLFIECAARLRRLAPGLPFRFVWIGSGYDPVNDTSYSVYLHDQIRRARLEDHVFFYGEVSSLSTAYDEADVFLLSSRLDPLPNVAIDALSEGIPVVCFDNSTGIADILKKNGLAEQCVADYQSTDDMAQKVKALSESQSRRRDVASRSKQIGISTFNMSRYVEQLERLALDSTPDKQQEKDDVATIKNSGLMRPDFSVPPHLQYLTTDESICNYVRAWATGIRRRKPIPGFHPGVYRERHDLASPKLDPFADYIREDRPEGIWRLPVLVPNDQLAVHPAGVRVALHVHTHYIDLFPEILHRLEHNELRPDLLISVHSESDRREIDIQTRHYSGSKVEVRVVPNKGRDIGPFLTEFGDEIRQMYDVVGHLHTKKTLILKDEAVGRAWFLFLLENLLGGKGKMADTIVSEFAQIPEVGLIFPDDPNVMEWGRENRSFADKLSHDMGIDTLPDQFSFPIGTMFWARVSALEGLFALHLGWDDYPDEPVPYDGTLLHAIERLLPHVALSAGHTLTVTNVPGITR